LLSCAQFAPGEVELLKVVQAGSMGGSKTDREAMRGVVLKKLGVPGLTGVEVDKAIAEIVRDHEGVAQEEFLQGLFSLLVHCYWL
jgi:hypothetical protein